MEEVQRHPDVFPTKIPYTHTQILTADVKTPIMKHLFSSLNDLSI